MRIKKWQLFTSSFILASIITLMVRMLLGQSATAFCLGMLPGIAFIVTEKLVKTRKLVII